MKILFIPNAHGKILKNMRLGFEKIGANVIYKNNPTDQDIRSSELVYSAMNSLPIQNYPCTLFIFGPNFCVFPEPKVVFNNVHKNAIYIQPSAWAVQVWRDLKYDSLPLYAYPVGVDTELFKPTQNISKRDCVFIYVKRRRTEELQLLQKHFPDAKIFTYGGYSESDYLAFLQKAKFGVWLAAHESEGFALLEALSCNVPLLVWSVTKMSQEIGHPERYNTIKTPVTTVPYWESRCGEVFHDSQELNNVKERFLENTANYKPREYILENLTVEKAAENFMALAKNIKNAN